MLFAVNPHHQYQLVHQSSCVCCFRSWTVWPSGLVNSSAEPLIEIGSSFPRRFVWVPSLDWLPPLSGFRRESQVALGEVMSQNVWSPGLANSSAVRSEPAPVEMESSFPCRIFWVPFLDWVPGLSNIVCGSRASTGIGSVPMSDVEIGSLRTLYCPEYWVRYAAPGFGCD